MNTDYQAELCSLIRALRELGVENYRGALSREGGYIEVKLGPVPTLTPPEPEREPEREEVLKGLRDDGLTAEEAALLYASAGGR